MGKRPITTEQFITKAMGTHGDKYDYSLVEYKNSKAKVKIICEAHGVFEQVPSEHIRGRGCFRCAGFINQSKDFGCFITRAKEVHGSRYSYDLVEYKNVKTKVTISCPVHGIFEQRPSNHLRGEGCQKCYFLDKRIKLVESLPPDDGAYIDDNDDIQCRCHYCGKYLKPTASEMGNRYKVMIGKSGGSANFYCSDGCKQECSVFNQQKYPKGFKTYSNSREVQPQLRKLVLERDNYTCQKCHSTENLHCHHMTGVEINPIESADIDNCITLCKGCHKEVHQQDGCAYQDYKRKKCQKD